MLIFENKVTPVKRHVITHVARDGIRILSHPAQGRFTHPSAQAAQAHLDAIKEGTDRATLEQVFHDPESMRVQEVDCYPNHHDPMQTVFPN